MPEVLVFLLLLVRGILNLQVMPDVFSLNADNQFISTSAHALSLLQPSDTHTNLRTHWHSRMSLSLFAETCFKTLKIARAFLARPRCCHRGR